MAKTKGGQDLPLAASSDLISFLKKEFSVAKIEIDSAPIKAPIKTPAKISTKTPAKNAAKSFAKAPAISANKSTATSVKRAERKKSADSLAFASKLSKSVEVFLQDENEGKKAFEIDFPSDWNKEYSKKQADLLRSADEIFSKKKAYRNSLPVAKASSYSTMASVANDNVVKWTAVVLLILNISIYLGLFHGKTADLIISSINRPIAMMIKSVTSSEKAPSGGVSDFAATEKAPKREISKKEMADFIRKNDGNITDEMAVSEEDLGGQVAGVSE